MESIELTEQQKYGIEIAVNQFMKLYPEVKKVKIDQITSWYIYLKFYVELEALEEIGGIKVTERVRNRILHGNSPEWMNSYMFLSVIYANNEPSEETEIAKEKIYNYEKKMIKRLNTIYSNFPESLKIRNNMGSKLEFSMSNAIIF